MVRALIRFGVLLLANAVGLWVADLVLEDFSIEWSSFLIAVLIFTVVEAIAQPFFTSLAVRRAQVLQGATALITTFVGLLITTWVTDGLQIDGVWTWIIATVIVWLASLLAGLILPIFLVKEAVDNNRA
jgi:uncharacterized membrane protein YvlD (DUF360 family)